MKKILTFLNKFYRIIFKLDKITIDIYIDEKPRFKKSKIKSRLAKDFSEITKVSSSNTDISPETEIERWRRLL